MFFPSVCPLFFRFLSFSPLSSQPERISYKPTCIFSADICGEIIYFYHSCFPMSYFKFPSGWWFPIWKKSLAATDETDCLSSFKYNSLEQTRATEIRRDFNGRLQLQRATPYVVADISQKTYEVLATFCMFFVEVLQPLIGRLERLACVYRCPLSPGARRAASMSRPPISASQLRRQCRLLYNWLGLSM